MTLLEIAVLVLAAAIMWKAFYMGWHGEAGTTRAGVAPERRVPAIDMHSALLQAQGGNSRQIVLNAEGATNVILESSRIAIEKKGRDRSSSSENSMDQEKGPGGKKHQQPRRR